MSTVYDLVYKIRFLIQEKLYFLNRETKNCFNNTSFKASLTLIQSYYKVYLDFNKISFKRI